MSERQAGMGYGGATDFQLRPGRNSLQWRDLFFYFIFGITLGGGFGESIESDGFEELGTSRWGLALGGESYRAETCMSGQSSRLAGE
jgi:hypothetical protein